MPDLTLEQKQRLREASAKVGDGSASGVPGEWASGKSSAGRGGQWPRSTAAGNAQAIAGVLGLVGGGVGKNSEAK